MVFYSKFWIWRAEPFEMSGIPAISRIFAVLFFIGFRLQLLVRELRCVNALIQSDQSKPPSVSVHCGPHSLTGQVCQIFSKHSISTFSMKLTAWQDDSKLGLGNRVRSSTLSDQSTISHGLETLHPSTLFWCPRLKTQGMWCYTCKWEFCTCNPISWTS